MTLTARADWEAPTRSDRMNSKCPSAANVLAHGSANGTSLSSSVSHRWAHKTNRKLPPLKAVGRTAFSVESKRLLKLLLTRQAVRTTLNYLSETNGELHYFLHQYVADNPLPLDPRIDPDSWLADLASTPLTKVKDPRRSSIVSAASANAVLNGEREVSPRSVAERVLALRSHIAREMTEDLANIELENTEVLRAAAVKSVGKGLK